MLPYDVTDQGEARSDEGKEGKTYVLVEGVDFDVRAGEEQREDLGMRRALHERRVGLPPARNNKGKRRDGDEVKRFGKSSTNEELNGRAVRRKGHKHLRRCPVC